MQQVGSIDRGAAHLEHPIASARSWTAVLVLALAALTAGCGGISSSTHSGSALSSQQRAAPDTQAQKPATSKAGNARNRGSQAGRPGSFSLNPARSSLDTNQTDQIEVVFPGGEKAPVSWSIADGQNSPSLGQGSISASGLYTPPPVLSASMVSIEVKAALKDNPAVAATYILTVTPGFVEALTPQNANLSAGGQIQITAEIAEVNSGSVLWQLAADAAGSSPAGRFSGRVSSTGCRHSTAGYTACTATYTAPRTLPPGPTSVYVAALTEYSRGKPRTIHILLNHGRFNSSPLSHQQAETGLVEMGVSGGNANDFDSSQAPDGSQYVDDCCGGTLGALVKDGAGDLYILSNNHVLAESDQARPGDSIVQPALIDSNCNPQAGRTVGSLRYQVPLDKPNTNVDAALAAATPAVDPSGSILELGPAENGSLSPAPPAAGDGEALTPAILNQLQGVVKSGRTTGLTCSSIGAVDLTVAVDYYYDCAETRHYYTKIFTGQIGVRGKGFADSGDSGALLLDRTNAEPIGLLFATGGNNRAGFTVANPIRDVLHELATRSQAGGREFQIVGGAQHPITCSNFNPDRPPAPRPLTPAQRETADSAARLAAAEWMRPGSGILGVGVGRSLDRPEEPAVFVYVSRMGSHFPVPITIQGLRTVVVRTDAAGAAAHIPQVDPANGIHLSAATLQAAEAVVRQQAAQLMKDPAIFGVGVTQSYDDPAEAALLVLVDRNRKPKSMPDVIGGLRVRYLAIHRLHVTRSRFRSNSRPTACELRRQDGKLFPPVRRPLLLNPGGTR